MGKHPFHDVAIVGVYNTKAARRLEGYDSESITLEAIKGVLNDAGLSAKDIDGVSTSVMNKPTTLVSSAHLTYLMGIKDAWVAPTGGQGIAAIIEAAEAIALGECHTVLIATGQAGLYTERDSTAPWTRPTHEFIECWGMFTAAEFALVARRHMHLYGTTPEQMARVAAVIRNNGSLNPAAVYYNRGPFTVADILASRMVADPFHLLECAMTSEGGAAMILTTVERARNLKEKPIWILGGARESCGPSYYYPPSWDRSGRLGAAAAKKSFAMAGIGPEDVDLCMFYDPFSFEIIRQFEAYGFCGEGEGGSYVMTDIIERTGKHPIVPDGGLQSFSHAGLAGMLQRATEGVKQLRGTGGATQIPDRNIAMCANGGGGANFLNLVLLGKVRP